MNDSNINSLQKLSDTYDFNKSNAESCEIGMSEDDNNSVFCTIENEDIIHMSISVSKKKNGYIVDGFSYESMPVSFRDDFANPSKSLIKESENRINFKIKKVNNKNRTNLLSGISEVQSNIESLYKGDYKPLLDNYDINIINKLNSSSDTKEDFKEDFDYLTSGETSEFKMKKITVASEYDILFSLGALAGDLDDDEITKYINPRGKDRVYSVVYEYNINNNDENDFLTIIMYQDDEDWKIVDLDPSNMFDYVEFTLPESREKTTVDSAEITYENNCTACHAHDLSGGSAPDLRKVGAKYSKSEIKDILENGKGDGMPAGLLDGEEEEKNALVEWLSEKK